MRFANKKDATGWVKDFEKSYNQKPIVIKVSVPKNSNISVETYSMDGRTAIFIKIESLNIINKTGTINTINLPPTTGY